MTLNWFIRIPLNTSIENLIKIEQCDDDDNNDGVSIHNLTESQLIISSDYENETFEYYTASDLNTSSLIADPTKFQNDPFNDSVYVKIITSNNCYRTSQNTDIDGETNITYKPTEIGTYAVRGTITCTGATYKSSDIPISICPTDFDDDGIVDNLDLDNDNDGILNSIESYL